MIDSNIKPSPSQNTGINKLIIVGVELGSDIYLDSSYFPRDKEVIAKSGRRQKREMRKLDLLAHWEECENRHLHVAPSRPPPLRSPLSNKYKPKVGSLAD